MKATRRLGHLPIKLGCCREFLGIPLLSFSCMFYAHLSCLWSVCDWSGKQRGTIKISFCSMGFGLAISSKVAGPESRTLTLFPHLSRSLEMDLHLLKGMASPGRDGISHPGL